MEVAVDNRLVVLEVTELGVTLLTITELGVVEADVTLVVAVVAVVGKVMDDCTGMKLVVGAAVVDTVAVTVGVAELTVDGTHGCEVIYEKSQENYLYHYRNIIIIIYEKLLDN